MTSGDDPRRGDFKLRDACRSHAAVSGAGVRARTNRYVRWHCRSRAARPPVGGRGPPAFTEGSTPCPARRLARTVYFPEGVGSSGAGSTTGIGLRRER